MAAGLDARLATLRLHSEIAAVVTALRQRQWAWQVPGRYNEEDRIEPEPHYDEFRILRRKIFDWSADWGKVQPLEYLTPFLKLVREPEVSGPITGVALTALWRILNSDLISPDTPGAAEAVNRIVEDTTQCKFEATNPASDEVVLFNILQVLQAVVNCPAGGLLTDASVCRAYQAAFMLGSLDRNSKEGSEQLSHYSRQIIGEMTEAIFGTLSGAPQTAAAVVAARRRSSAAGSEGVNGSTRVSEEGAPPSPFSLSSTASYGLPSALEVMAFLVTQMRSRSEDVAGPGGDDGSAVFGLHMMHRAVLAGGATLARHPALLALVQREVFPALVAAVRGGSAGLGVVNGVCQVMLALVTVMGSSVMLQVEVLLQGVLLKLADGRDTVGAEVQEAALEGLLDLCCCPGFLHAAFLSCDCRIERSNVFEDLCSHVAKTAFPVARARTLGPLHAISLDALLAVMASLSNLSHQTPQVQPAGELPHFLDVWDPICRAEEPPISDVAAQLISPSGGGGASTPPPSSAEASGGEPHARSPFAAAAGEAGGDGVRVTRAVTAAFEKRLKQVAALGVEHFNKDYKKGFQFLQANKLLPPLSRPGPDGATTAAAAAFKGDMDEDALAACIGALLHACPGLNKGTVGELLGAPEGFYLKVLDAFTASFDFRGVPFDTAIRLFLESFLLPGEAQKIDRIINSFGRHYFAACPHMFRHEDAAYILSYSVIMLNTDRHSSQVKTKMSLDAFRRNLRGVNDGQDFPQEVLDEIYASIVHSPLRLSDGSAADVSPATWAALAQHTGAPRGGMVTLPPAEAHALDGYMFSLVWGPSVHAMAAALEGAESEAAVRTAIDGLKMACQTGAHYEVEGVVDAVVLALAKFSAALSPAVPKARALFGRDGKAQAAVEALVGVVTRYGDCLRSGWGHVLDLVLRLNKLDLLPPALEDLLAMAYDAPGSGGVLSPGNSGVFAPYGGEGAAAGGGGGEAAEGGAPPPDGVATPDTDPGATPGSPPQPPPTPPPQQKQEQQAATGAPNAAVARRRARRAAYNAARGGGGGGGMSTSFLRSVTQLIALQEPEYDGKASAQMERELEARTLEVLHVRCALQDVFADSRFLRPEALQAMVVAIIAAPGPLPDVAAAPPLERSSSGALGGAGGPPDWESLELCLDLLLVVLLRNRDRLALLWPPVFEHLTLIIRGKGLDPGVVQSAASGVLRLCQRLLPYKPEVAELLLRGLQLVPGLDPEVAWLNAEAIASDMLGLVQGCAPHIRQQWAWASVCNLLKMTSVRREAFPVSLTALRWTVGHHTTPLNYVLALEAAVWFVERAALEHPTHKADALALLDQLERWLEVWAASLPAEQLTPEQAATFATARSEFWLYLVETCARLGEHSDMEVRACAAATLHAAAVGAERVRVLPSTVERAIAERLLPPLEALSKRARGRELRQAEVVLRELVVSITKLVLLFLPGLQPLPSFPTTWQGILRGVCAAHAAGGDMLSETVPECLNNMLLALHGQGVLHPGWCDAHGTNLWEVTWRSARKVSSNLTPLVLVPPVNPTRQELTPQQQPPPQQQQQQLQQPPAGLATPPAGEPSSVAAASAEQLAEAAGRLPPGGEGGVPSLPVSTGAAVVAVGGGELGGVVFAAATAATGGSSSGAAG